MDSESGDYLRRASRQTDVVGRQRRPAMFIFRACPRCEGDLIVGDEEDESAVTCLQCGYVGELPIARLAERTEPGPVPQDGARHVTGFWPEAA